MFSCNFFALQAIMKNATQKGAAVKKNLKNQPEQHFIIRQFQALALLPEHLIKPTYHEIKKNATNRKFGSDFDKFFEYFESHWLER